MLNKFYEYDLEYALRPITAKVKQVFWGLVTLTMCGSIALVVVAVLMWSFGVVFG